jgi:molybdopterin-guanine dinucleotide biosynthesis protein A
MPFLHPGVVRLVVERAPMGDVVIPRVDGIYETMHAAYGKACLPAMEERLGAGQLKIAGFFDRVRVVEISEADVARLADPRIAFMNVNTPEELARARVLAERRA